MARVYGKLGIRSRAELGAHGRSVPARCFQNYHLDDSVERKPGAATDLGNILAGGSANRHEDRLFGRHEGADHDADWVDGVGLRQSPDGFRAVASSRPGQ